MKTAIVYWSGTGNTKAMAGAIAAGMKEKGAQADVFAVDEVNASIVNDYDKLALGCPSMGVEELEENEFAPFFDAVEAKLSGRKVALFGSYGWGDGEWMRNWFSRAQDAGANLCGEGFIQQDAPDEAACRDFGAQFADF